MVLATMRLELGRLRTVPALSLLAVLGSACATGLGPKAVRNERPDYNQQILRSANAELLLNLVRLRYNDTPLFLELGTVVASYGYDASLNAGGTIPASGTNVANLGSAFAYGEHPTITYTPLTGEQFATRMLTPIPLDALMLFEQSGWRADRLLLVAVQRVNDLLNAPTASGPTPEREPYYEAFDDFAERFERLRSAGLMGFNWEVKEHEKDPPGRNPRFWIRAPADPNSALAADVASVRRALDLEAGKEEFYLSGFPYKRMPNEVAVRCRSLLGVLYFLSNAVELPAEHVKAGLVTVTVGDDGQPFSWSKVTGKVLTVHSQEGRPQKAYVAVQHRGWWFYIADDDRSSKATFSLLNILYSLQQATGQGKSPVLTLPVVR